MTTLETSTEEVQPVASVTLGVFFDPPQDVLPRGRHGMPREQVNSAQRERIMVAATELLAARGFQALRVADVASRARVSLSACYKLFPGGLQQCLFAGYDRFIEVLVAKILAAVEDLGSEPSQTSVSSLIEAVISAYLGTLRSDPVVARAYQVEMDAIGADARMRRRQSLELIANLLHDKHAAASDASLPVDAFKVLVYGVRQLAADGLEVPRYDTAPLLPQDAQTISWLQQLLSPVTTSIVAQSEERP